MMDTRATVRATAVMLCAASALLVAGCEAGSSVRSGSDDATAGTGRSSSTTQAPQPAQFAFVPASGASAVRPDQSVTVSAQSGTLSSVVVKDAKGATLPGTMAAGTWKASSHPRPATAYTITASGIGPDGTATTTTSRFTTLTPTVTATYGVFHAGETVGVGMPATIQFDSAVTDKAYRQRIERAVTISTTPETQGSWGWLDNRQLMWRPKDYWKPGTKVSVKAPLTGFQTGPAKWVAKDMSASFTIGDARISYVNMRSHTMRVTKNGQTMRTIPVSTGKDDPRFETRYGTKVIITKEGTVTMDSATVGIPKGSPDYYKLVTHSNLRVTWTGEYLHSAPWSQGSQGRANVSHGCVNMAPGNAAWMFDFSRVGDVVTFTGSSRPFLPTEGIGVWAYSWANWQKQSALHGSPSASTSPSDAVTG